MDTWDEGRYDVILLCGILYHLTQPWHAIERFCRMAAETIVVSAVVHGHDECGYSPHPEWHTIGASEDPTRDSMMPNNTETLVSEFAKHGFGLAEGREHVGAHGGLGCALLLARGAGGGVIQRSSALVRDA